MTVDLIRLEDLRVSAVVGVLPEERTRPQPLSIDLDLEVDLTRAGLSDRLEDSVDYGTVCDRVFAVTTKGAPQLLERLASLIVAELFECFEQLDAATIEVRKLRPPVPHQLASSGVRISRRAQR